jgi:hypothetical protein
MPHPPPSPGRAVLVVDERQMLIGLACLKDLGRSDLAQGERLRLNIEVAVNVPPRTPAEPAMNQFGAST